MVDRLHQFQAEFGPQAEQLKEQALEYAAVAREGLARGGEAVKRYITEQPVRALGIAFGMGVFLGWLIKRR